MTEPTHSDDSDPEADDSDDGMPMGPDSFCSKYHSKYKRSKKRARVDTPKTQQDGDDQPSQPSKGEAAQASDASDDSDDDPTDNGVITVDFLFENFKEIDFHGIKGLLEKGAWDQVNTSEIADALVTQKGVGTSLKIDDASEVVYGLMSALNVGTSVGKVPSVGAMCSFLQRACKDTNTSSMLSTLLSTSELAKAPVGIVVNERFVNMPPNVAPALYQSLVDDLAWATAHDQKEAYKYLVMFTKCYVEETKSQNGGGKKRGKKRKKKNKGGSGNGGGGSSSSSSSSETAVPPQMYFIKFEDEIFHQHATLSYSFPAASVSRPSESSNIGFGTESYMVMVLDTSVLPQCIETMNAMVATVE
jgi:protein BCP1